MVMTKRMIQYITRTGQKTGILKISNQAQKNPIAMARVALCQNLNSGNRRMKGRNSSSAFVGKADGPPFSISSSSTEGSNLGVKKARKRLRRYIPSV